MTEEPENTEETEETPAAEAEETAAAEAEETPAAEAEEAAPAAALSPKQRRKRERSLHTGEARSQRSAEERQAERAEERQRKAVRRRAYRQHAKQKRAERRAAAPPREEAPPLHPEGPEGKRKVRQGVVVSDKADKTITVRIDIARRHRLYEKVIRSSGTLHAHDERNEAGVGDTVRVVESRPLSRSKRWRLVEILERAR
jgi:small subunit ribosomal protein S17